MQFCRMISAPTVRLHLRGGCVSFNLAHPDATKRAQRERGAGGSSTRFLATPNTRQKPRLPCKQPTSAVHPRHKYGTCRNDNGYHLNDNGYHLNDNGYHSNDNGYHSNDNGYHSNDNGYHSNDNGYRSNNHGTSFRDVPHISMRLYETGD
jgi:hypothetical protein